MNRMYLFQRLLIWLLLLKSDEQRRYLRELERKAKALEGMNRDHVHVLVCILPGLMRPSPHSSAITKSAYECKD